MSARCFAAACSGKIIDLKPQYSNSNKWNNTEQPRGGDNTFTRYQSYHLLLHLLLSTNRHFYSLPKILPFFFITPYNSYSKSPFSTATKDTSDLVQGRQVHYQCHAQQYHLNRARDRTRPNLGPARARSTNIRLNNICGWAAELTLRTESGNSSWEQGITHCGRSPLVLEEEPKRRLSLH
jgi:hypothetical protein